MEFSHELVLALLQPANLVLVDIDNAWQWLSYSSKAIAPSEKSSSTTASIAVFAIGEAV
jgi:hypothetical protein